MAWKDIIPNRDLLNYLSEVHDMLVYYLEIHHSDAIEGFLNEYNQEFMEWVESELGDDSLE